MDFMTTITPTPVRNHRRGLAAFKESGTNGFTLVELMIGSTLGAFILAAVLSTFLFMGRSGANVQNYNDMESQARNALELFAQDTRQASGIVWTDANTVVLTVATLRVTYQYNPTAQRFARQEAVIATGVVNSTRVLITGITSFTFSAYNITGANVPISTATERTAANGTTKQLQISLEAARNSRTVVAATNTVLSARFVLRNKRVTV
jgi:prepilin-type N-terminal cleavage/methylation domain-containing protein